MDRAAGFGHARSIGARSAGAVGKGKWTVPESVYKVIEIIGTSSESWERAAAVAVERAAQTLRDLRIAEVVEQDVVVEDGRIRSYRTKLKLSFKYEG
ncbi:MAG: dodecin domain-containing protein [Geminicoccaceae bacterium]|nr:dodecin domain-containing protein [Geminicoccaceae bacterium]